MLIMLIHLNQKWTGSFFRYNWISLRIVNSISIWITYKCTIYLILFLCQLQTKMNLSDLKPANIIRSKISSQYFLHLLDAQKYYTMGAKQKMQQIKSSWNVFLNLEKRQKISINVKQSFLICVQTKKASTPACRVDL